MCTPVVAMAFTAMGAIQQAQSAQAAANYQAQVAENNAKIAGKQAENASEVGAQQEKQLRQRTQALEATQRVGYSASGLDISGGSPLAVLGDTAYLGELDAQTSRFNTAQRVWGLKNQQNDYISQAGYARAAGSNAATGALLNGVSSLAGQYSYFNGGGSNPWALKTKVPSYTPGSYSSGYDFS